MGYSIINSTDAVKKEATQGRGIAKKYPWNDLQVGQSFIIPSGEVTYRAMCSLAYKTGKKLNKTFSVADHKEHGIEVGRLADPAANSFPQSFDARNYKIETPKIVSSVGNKEETDYKEWDDIPPMTTKPVVEEPWKSPILDPRINPANVVKRVEVSVEPQKSEWTLPKKEGE